MSTMLHNHFREKAVALLVAQHDANADVLHYGAEDEAAFIEAHVHECSTLEPAARLQQLQAMKGAEEIVVMSEVHPAWLVDIMAKESPRVVGVLLRFLPSQHARYVVEHLPPALAARLPHIVDAFAVPEAIVRIVRRRFEAHFVPVRPRTTIDEFTLHDITALRLHDLPTVLRDLGIHELAMALARIGRPALQVIFNRLDFADAKALHARMQYVHDVDAQLLRDASFAILDMSFESHDVSQLLQEIGVQALAKAMQAVHLDMVPVLKQKLPPHFAYLLQRDVDMHVPNNEARVARARQHQVLACIARLAHEGLIEARWYECMPQVVRESPIVSGMLAPVGADGTPEKEVA